MCRHYLRHMRSCTASMRERGIVGTTVQRIVSLLPSTTEMVCLLGLRDRLVGISHECDFPENVRGLPVLTAPKIDPGGRSAEIDRQVREVVASGLSVYRIDQEKLRELRPDLI